MIEKKQLAILLVSIGLVASFVFLKRKSRCDAKNNVITIGIIQTASHPALDAVKNGFMQELRDQLGCHVEFIERNAQGIVAHAHTIAQNFHADKAINAIFAIATPALQAAASVEKQRPIFFGAVTDPRALGVVQPHGNVTGSSDMINIPDTIALVRELIPKARHVALLYNNAEPNSLTAALSMKKELTNANYIVSNFAITNESELLPALESALESADVLLAPTDNTIASAIDLIAQKAIAAQKPLVVSDNMLVARGPLAARGIDYTVNGKQAAQQAVAVLIQGKKPSELPIGYATSGRIFVNKNTLQSLGLTIPATLAEHVSFIAEKGD